MYRIILIVSFIFLSGKNRTKQAINYNSVECVQYLIDFGEVDINWVDSRGTTPMQLAKQRGLDAIVQILSDYAQKP